MHVRVRIANAGRRCHPWRDMHDNHHRWAAHGRCPTCSSVKCMNMRCLGRQPWFGGDCEAWRGYSPLVVTGHVIHQTPRRQTRCQWIEAGFKRLQIQIRDGGCPWINTRTRKSSARPSTAYMAGPTWITSGVARSLLEIARELVPIGP